MSDTLTKKTNFADDLLPQDGKHRGEKDWKMLFYASGILLAIITVIGTIFAGPLWLNLAIRQRVAIVVTLLVITIATGLWLYRDPATGRILIKQLIHRDYGLESLAGFRWTNILTYTIPALLLFFVIGPWAVIWLSSSQPQPVNKSATWYFAVSGDSRDCGDLIMPKIAQAIADNKQKAPVDFYWHLGDLRAIYRFDCDMKKFSSFKCPPKIFPSTKAVPMQKEYLSEAWPDFIKSQIIPFEKAGLPFYVGIGNHEVSPPKTRDQFREHFKKWLTQPTIQAQRESDRPKIPSEDGDTYFHFIWKGVDIIYLDNSSIDNDTDPGFSKDELDWLELVLQRDEADPQVNAIIVGMHAALPESISRNHAMDKNCASFCAGKKVYDRLSLTQSRGKKVYILASHSHYFEENVYDTPEHNNHGLPGWIIGTAGAEQHRPQILYGYLLVEVGSDGTIQNSFQSVGRDSAPQGPAALTRYCFEQNIRKSVPKETHKTAPECGCAH